MISDLLFPSGGWLIFLAASLLAGPLALAQSPGADLSRLDYRLQPRQVSQDVWVIEGTVGDFSPTNGCNIINTGFIQAADALWVVNTGPSYRYGQQQRQAIEKTVAASLPVRVLNLNLHPDYFFGNQAWADKPLMALPGSVRGMQAEGEAYATNLYALCGDWMKDTAATPANTPITPDALSALSPPVSGNAVSSQPRLEWLHLRGHTADDLVVLDHASGVVFTGGLVFVDRLPTTPHADIAVWLENLDVLEQRLSRFPLRALVPSHGPVRADMRGIGQTREYLQWLTQWLAHRAQQGLDLSEVLALPLPAPFAHWAAPSEFGRSITQLYPSFERRALGSGTR